MESSATVQTASTKKVRRVLVPPPLEAMLDAIPVFAALVRTDGTIAYCNDPLARIYGWLADARSGHRLDEILPSQEADRLLASDTASSAPVRTTLASPAGAPLTVEWSARLLPTEVGDTFLCLTGRDVSRETQLENHLVHNQWFETAAALSGGMAHDFNNVLAAILGLSEIIALRLPPDSALQEYAAKIGISIDRAKILVRRFSQFSRKCAGDSDALPTALVLDELTKLLRGFLPGSVIFATELAPDTPWCEADRYVLEQIVLNCANFLRARLRTDNGTVKLSSGAAADGRRPRITLRGSGQGLLGLDLESCFALDLRPTATAYESGTGLHVARLLATRQNATLRLIRHDPRTVSFELELPAAQ